jgi:hypothetical protein
MPTQSGKKKKRKNVFLPIISFSFINLIFF